MPAKPYPADAAVLAFLEQKLHASLNTDAAITAMRTAGFNKIDCIKFVREFGNVTLGQAKDIVHLSPAWADRYESDEAFHDALEQAFEISDEEERTAA